MLDILLEALVELFGGKKPQAPVRRRTRRAEPQGDRPRSAPGAPSARTNAPAASENRGWPDAAPDGSFGRDVAEDAAPGETMTLETLVRRMIGVEEQERTPPPRPARPRQEQRPKSRGQRTGKPRPQPAKPKPVVPALLETRQGAGVPATSASPAKREEGTGLEFVAALRGNPEAARKAFVYSEIFGRPLGDR